MGRRRLARRWPLLLAVLLLLALQQWQGRAPVDGASSPSGTDTVEQLASQGRSGAMVLAKGHVSRTLADDNEGSRHQRFIVELPSGHTVLVAHNIDLAPRVPLGAGDAVVVYGQFEDNPRGGVLHWTHHDPRGVRNGGWIEHGGQRYR